MTRKEYNNAIDLFSENIFRYAYGWTKSRETSEDIVQEAFERLWNNRKKVKFQKSKSWLFTTAHNLLVNYSRKKKIILSHEHQPNEPSFYTDHLYDLRNLIEVIMKDLPDVQRSILLLRDFEGYSYKEIAVILKINEPQVKVYLFRARKKIKQHLKDLTILS